MGGKTDVAAPGPYLVEWEKRMAAMQAQLDLLAARITALEKTVAAHLDVPLTLPDTKPN